MPGQVPGHVVYMNTVILHQYTWDYQCRVVSDKSHMQSCIACSQACELVTQIPVCGYGCVCVCVSLLTNTICR